MQRRAAAAYFAFFLVVGAAAYGYIGYAEANQRPQFSVEGQEIPSEGSATIDGTTYSLSAIETSGGGGHGGGGGQLESELTWTNESARITETLSNGSAFTYQGIEYEVVLTGGANATSFRLRETFNVTALLRDDPAVENELATFNGTDQVVARDDGSLTPLSEYLPEPRTQQFSVGDTLPYQNQTATVASIDGDGVTLAWEGSAERSVDLVEGGNVTLGNGQQYFVHYDGHEAVTLAQIGQYDEYATTVDERNYFHERINGLWGIVIVSGTAAILLLSMAYLPHRG